jgi:hypothetical protein
LKPNARSKLKLGKNAVILLSLIISAPENPLLAAIFSPTSAISFYLLIPYNWRIKNLKLTEKPIYSAKNKQQTAITNKSGKTTHLVKKKPILANM